MDQAGTTTCFNRTPFHSRGKGLQSLGGCPDPRLLLKWEWEIDKSVKCRSGMEWEKIKYSQLNRLARS